ncbi:hypothetical protein [Sphaerisporangium corydalis]|uniref:Secreted protein n=1 Tax=Sphaerisporangium corydalis TaxID=1441875 RepID=A0ABV9ECM4_9ACTN|nr:hypothetical protein [Sphaerisporangium corydalis]
MRSTRHFSRVGLAAVACLAGLLAGCGTGGTGGASGSGGGPGEPVSASGSAGTADQRYTEWELKFRSCLGDKGFELPKEPGKIDFGDRQDAYKVAEEGCLKKIGKPPAASDGRPGESAAEAKEAAEKTLKSLQCLRDLGYDVADPENGQPARIEAPEGASQEDMDKCFSR